MTKCPTTGNAVATGHHMTQAQLDGANARYAFRCTDCNEIHNWVRDEAWVREVRVGAR